MSTRIVTLFGEEIVPEQQKPAPKTRGKKKDQKDDAEDEDQAGEDTVQDETAVAATETPADSTVVSTDPLTEAIAATAPEESTALPEALMIITTPATDTDNTTDESAAEPEIIAHPFFSMTDDDIETDGVTETFTDIEEGSGNFITLAGAIMDTAPAYPSDIPGAMLIIAEPAAPNTETEETQAITEEPAATEENSIAEPVAAIEIADATPVTEETTDVAETITEVLPATEVTEAPVMETAPAETTTEAAPDTTGKRSRKAAKEESEEYDIPAKTPADIIPEDWHGDKNYYTIGEVAEFFKVKTSHIRFWTNEFKMKVRTTRKGDRLYTPANVKELRAIYHLVKERGFTLAGAKTKLKTQNKRDVTTVDLKTSLTQLKSKLLILREQLL